MTFSWQTPARRRGAALRGGLGKTADAGRQRVLKGNKALYRARFAGFDKATADATCKQLKRNDFDCITVKN